MVHGYEPGGDREHRRRAVPGRRRRPGHPAQARRHRDVRGQGRRPQHGALVRARDAGRQQRQALALGRVAPGHRDRRALPGLPAADRPRLG
ncbi:hypothetical protein [Nocardioides convexus]|uniref:hypothetical protein n=1 Tax=Nocardioides convexus TaxID=2712224 RepID=UPI002418A404|nr:hypothetical protein [Nocardioides convexus]